MPENIEKRDITEEDKNILTELGFLITSYEEEKREMLGFMDELNSLNKTLRIILVMNLDCNLACKYCFEGSRKGKFYMTRETADLFVKFLQKKAHDKGWGYENIKITFYGGEPLLSTDLIVYILERLQPWVYASLITNGTLLTSKVVTKLKRLGLKAASVTLDGPKEIHNHFRPYKSGRGTFVAIVNNIKEVCNMIDIQLGGNFTKENFREFPRLLDYLIENGLTPDKLSSVEFSPVVNESKEFAPADFHDGCKSINEPWLCEAGLFLREEILTRGFKTQKITPATCMIEMKDNLVVNYDGSFYKCPGLLGRKEFQAGDLQYGVKDYSAVHNLDNWKNAECLECGYLPLCFGGCRYMKLLRNNNIKGVDCKKPYFDNVLKELVFQDIKFFC